MSIRNLDALFQPRSVAVVGASRRPGAVGHVVMRNLLEGGFEGPVLPVNPKADAVAGVLAAPDVASLPIVPDLAVVCTPPAAVPQVIADLAARGTRAAAVLTAGLDAPAPNGGTLAQAMLDAARPHLLRVLGPNSVGLLAPRAGLNASFAHAAALPGRIGFVSQSGALCTAVLDWAKAREIGFSCFVSLGNSDDVDFGDVIDYLASDAETRAILLYIEAIGDARKFMSAARAAARNKPVIAVKAGRAAEGARAAASHTGALAGSDDVYAAALARAGIVRVDDIDALFDAVETLARAKPLRGERLAILTNGGGPGVLATDTLVLHGGRLAELGEETRSRLDAVLPPTWSKGNPIDIIGDAPATRYAEALGVLLEAAEVDAVLVAHAPTAIVPSGEIAEALVPLLVAAKKPVFTSWLGADAVAGARGRCLEAGIPDYETPETAVRAFLQLVEYRRTQDLLLQTPPAVPEAFEPDAAAARAIIEAALADGRQMLSEPEAKDLLAAYGVPVVATRIAHDADEAEALAAKIGFPVAVKVLSPDISHKSDVGGVALDLADAPAVRRAVGEIAGRLASQVPGARLEGYTVQPMARRPGAHELIVGAALDVTFGPTILFGQGGTAVEVIADRAIGLPPLNLALARDLVGRTRIARLLAGYRDRPAADMAAIALTLVKVSQIVCDLDTVAEIDVNPLLADADGVLALDARIRLAPPARAGIARLAIRPYPRELEDDVRFGEESIRIRPIRPEDEPAYRRFFDALDSEDVYFRFFTYVKQLSHDSIARLTQIDYDREMAFIAERRPSGEILGVVRAIFDPEGAKAEFGILVRSDLKGRGLGHVLLRRIVGYCRDRGAAEINGRVLAHNRRMIQLARGLGFEIEHIRADNAVEVRLALR